MALHAYMSNNSGSVDLNVNIRFILKISDIHSKNQLQLVVKTVTVRLEKSEQS